MASFAAEMAFDLLFTNKCEPHSLCNGGRSASCAGSQKGPLIADPRLNALLVLDYVGVVNDILSLVPQDSCDIYRMIT